MIDQLRNSVLILFVCYCHVNFLFFAGSIIEHEFRELIDWY